MVISPCFGFFRFKSSISIFVQDLSQQGLYQNVPIGISFRETPLGGHTAMNASCVLPGCSLISEFGFENGRNGYRAVDHASPSC